MKLPVMLAIALCWIPTTMAVDVAGDAHVALASERFYLNTVEGKSNELKTWIPKFLDPNCLSDPNLSTSVVIKVAKSEVPEFKIHSPKNATQADKFYCEQAVWEAFPHHHIKNISVTVELNPNNSEMHMSFPELRSEDKSVIKMHLIPMSVALQSNSTIDPLSISSDANTVKLNVRDCKSHKLAAFRGEWVQFIANNPRAGRDEVLSQSKKMRHKYKALFH